MGAKVLMGQWYDSFPFADWQKHIAGKAKYSLGGASFDHWNLPRILELASLEELQRWKNLSLQYTDIAGGECLRDKISSLYVNLTSENIVVFSGAQDAITAFYMAVLKPQMSVLSITPNYPLLTNPAPLLGGNLRQFPMSYKDKNWQIDWSMFLSTIEDSSIVAVNFPHNPTGLVISGEQQQSLIDQIEQTHSWLLSDEVFHGLESEPSKRLVPAACLSERAISVGSISKAFGVSGLRVGWVASKNCELLKRLQIIKRYFSVCISQLDELLAEVLIKNADQVWEENRHLIAKNREIFAEWCRQNPHWIELPEQKDNLVSFPKLLNKKSSQEFCQQLISKYSIRFEPGTCFGDFAHHIRVGLGSRGFKDILGELPTPIRDL
jgi:aspartate/methionine/tyrosine aminotransferase